MIGQYLFYFGCGVCAEEGAVVALFGELLREPALVLYEHYIRHLIARDFLSRDDQVQLMC